MDDSSVHKQPEDITNVDKEAFQDMCAQVVEEIKDLHLLDFKKNGDAYPSFAYLRTEFPHSGNQMILHES